MFCLGCLYVYHILILQLYHFVPSMARVRLNYAGSMLLSSSETAALSGASVGYRVAVCRCEVMQSMRKQM